MKKKLFVLALFFLWAVPVFAQVDTAWVRRYSGPGSHSDYASTMTMDKTGNVYVTGYSFESGTGFDFATIKYYPNGDTAWVRRYNGPASGADYAYDIVVDNSGNVYITGESCGSEPACDYTTIKYDPSGNQLWVRGYNGPGNAYDYANAIAVDNSGNVYVTGQSYSGTSDDYATIKYYPNGDTAWVRRYDGPGNSDDIAYDIVVDNSGNVYVTGESCGSGTACDYRTIKYDPQGNLLWERSYNGPGNSNDLARAIALDNPGNVYVTGWSVGSGTGIDYATVKYDPSGTELWVRRYNGPGNSGDVANAIAIDNLRNVYVTGESYGSGTSYDYATIKYDSLGNQLWVRRYDGPVSGADSAYAIVVDNSGNAYVTGQSWGSGTSDDYATIKYDPQGNQLWVSRYNGLGNSGDDAYAIAVDSSRDVYVTGRSWGTTTGLDYATIKYVQFTCGDANGDGKPTVSDVVFLINYLFKGGPAPSPIQSGDANRDGKVSVSDVVYLINYLFKGGPPPCS